MLNQIPIVNGKGQNSISQYSAETYSRMFDLLLSEELCYESSAATENNIKRAMKLILGRAIKTGVIKSYSNLVLDPSLNVHFEIIDVTGGKFDLVLYYGG